MTSRFLLQVLDKATGEVVQFEPGLSVERDLVAAIATNLTPKQSRGSFGPFIDAVVKATLARGVGVLRTEDHVSTDLRDALHEVLATGVDDSLTQQLAVDVGAAVEAAFYALKAQVRP